MAGFFIADGFDDTNGTALPDHTPGPLGTTWVEEQATGTAVMEINTDSAEASINEASDSYIYTISDTPPSVEYNIISRLEITDTGGDEAAFLIARFADTSNYYMCMFISADDAADKRIHKVVATTVTEIASGDEGSDFDDRARFEITDARKALFWNDDQGTPTISSTDNVLTAAGLTGYGAGNLVGATDDIGVNYVWENFSVVDIDGLEGLDDFYEGAAPVALTSHTADVGGTWTEDEKTGTATMEVPTDDSVVDATAVEASDRVTYTLSLTPTDAEYQIEVFFSEFATGTDTDNPFWLIGRFADTSNFYFGGGYAAGAAADKKIYNEVATTVTQIATGDAGGIADSLLTFKVLDATKKIFFNGSEIISSTDNAITAKGSVGMGMGNHAISTDDITSAADVDVFAVSDIGVAEEGGDIVLFRRRLEFD